MTDETYASRIAEVEAYFTDRVHDPQWKTRWYYPDADEAMRYVCECIDADFFGIERPEPNMADYLKTKTQAVLNHFDERWKGQP